MKKLTGFQVFMAVLFITPLMLMAQEPQKKETITIRIEDRDENGNVNVNEQVIDATGMSQAEKDRILDSLDVKRNRKVTVHINKNDRFSREDSFDDDANVMIFRDRKMNKGGDFEMDIDRIIGQADRIARDIPRRIQRDFPQIYSWNGDHFGLESSSTIQKLDVFPNRPVNDMVNVRFYAPEEGDVNISVLNMQGEKLAQETVKAFKGEYTGQIRVKNLKAGENLLVLVSQANDGTSRKIMIEE